MSIHLDIKRLKLTKYLVSVVVTGAVTAKAITETQIIFGSLLGAYACHPSLEKKLFSYAILGFAIMISFLILQSIYRKESAETTPLLYKLLGVFVNCILVDFNTFFIKKYR